VLTVSPTRWLRAAHRLLVGALPWRA